MEDNQQQLRAEMAAMIEKGVRFKIPKGGLVKLLSRKNKSYVFHIKEPYLYTLDRLSDISIQMGFDEELLQKNIGSETKLLTKRAAKLAAKYTAYAILQKRINISILGRFLTIWLYHKLKPSILLNLTLIITQISNMAGFINSIRLIEVQRKATMTPNLMEEENWKA